MGKILRLEAGLVVGTDDQTILGTAVRVRRRHDLCGVQAETVEQGVPGGGILSCGHVNQYGTAVVPPVRGRRVGRVPGVAQPAGGQGVPSRVVRAVLDLDGYRAPLSRDAGR